MNLEDAVHLYLPKALTIPGGTISDFKWFQHEEIPDAQRAYPYGTFELLNSNPRGPVRKAGGMATLVLRPQSDVIAYSAGTDDYALTQQDAASITGVTGTVSAVTGHTFIQGTDYELLDRKTIRWLAGVRPDNATNFTVAYQHRMYRRRYGADGRQLCRLHVVAKRSAYGSKAATAHMLALAVEQYLRLNAGAVLSLPPASAPTALHLEAASGDFVTAQREFNDPSESVVSWAVDFYVDLAELIEGPETQAIKDVIVVPEGEA